MINTDSFWVVCVCSLATAACGSDGPQEASHAQSSTGGGASVETPDAAGTTGNVTVPTPLGNDVNEIVIETGAFTVPPGGEVYKCQDFQNPFDGKAVGIVATETDLTAGSHHMFAFVMPNQDLSLFDGLHDCPSGGTEFHEYVTTAGSPHSVTQYPDGVGRYFPESAGFRMNVHLFNATTEPLDAFIKLTVRYVDPAILKYKAASIFLNNVGLWVPPGTSVQTGTYTLPTDIWLLGGASHMHRLGTHFEAKTGDGQLLYQSDDWEEPQPVKFDPPISLAKGSTITWSCTYNNDTNQTFSFGDSAVNNEMCIFPGEFYNTDGVQLSSQYPFF